MNRFHHVSSEKQPFSTKGFRAVKKGAEHIRWEAKL